MKFRTAHRLLWGLLWCLPSARAQAAPVPIQIELQYERAPGAGVCPDAESFQEALKEQLGRNPVVDRAPTRVFIKLSPEGGGFEATMRQVDSAGQQIWTHDPIRAGNCEQLVGTVVISVSLAIEPLPALPPPSPPPSPAERPASPPPAVPPPPPSALVFRGGATVAVLFGSTPGPALGLGADLGLRYRFFSLSLEGRGTLPVDTTVTPATGGRGPLSTTLLLGSLVPCVHLDKLFVCAVVQAGRVSAAGPAAGGEMETQRAFHAAAGGRVGLELPILSHLALRVAADLTATLQPVKLEIEGHEQWTTFPVGAALGGGAFCFF